MRRTRSQRDRMGRPNASLKRLAHADSVGLAGGAAVGKIASFTHGRKYVLDAGVSVLATQPGPVVSRRGLSGTGRVIRSDSGLSAQIRV